MIEEANKEAKEDVSEEVSEEVSEDNAPDSTAVVEEVEPGWPMTAALKPAPVDRTIAKLVDFLIAAALFELPGVVGPLAALTYILISDGLSGGRSLGKRMVGLRVVSISRGLAPCDFKDSIIRNAAFGLVVIIFFIVGWIPYLGKMVAIVAWAAIVGYETMLVFSRASGLRFGDRVADTRVERVVFGGKG